MHTEKNSHTSHSLVLRVWQEDLGDGQTEWRGQVQKIGSDEVRYFRDWQTMVECVVEMLTEDDRISR